MTHRHFQSFDRAIRVYANRLILSSLDDSDDIAGIIGTEIDDCPQCWRRIAVYVAALASEHLAAVLGDEAEAIAETEARISDALDS